jgi:hypothetical protein
LFKSAKRAADPGEHPGVFALPCGFRQFDRICDGGFALAAPDEIPESILVPRSIF